MAKRSLFRQYEQVNGTVIFNDDMNVELAEACGRKYASSSTGDVSSAGVLTDNNVTFERSQVNDYIVFNGTTNSGVHQITAWNSAHQVQLAGTTAAENPVTYDIHKYKNLEDDLNYIRSQLNNVMGGADWKETPCTTLCDVASGIVSDSFVYMTDGSNTATASGLDTFTFVGSGGTTVVIDPVSKSITISGTQSEEMKDVTLAYNGTSGYWEYDGGFTQVPTDLQIFVNGNKNKANDTDYYTASVSAGVLQVSFAYHVGTDEWVNAVYNNTLSTGSGGTGTGLEDWKEITSNYTSSSGDRLIVNTSSDGSNGTAFTVTLPSSPSISNTVSFVDGGGACGTTNVTVDRNGEHIMDAASNLVIDTDNASFDLVYYNTSHGWRVVD